MEKASVTALQKPCQSTITALSKQHHSTVAVKARVMVSALLYCKSLTMALALLWYSSIFIKTLC